MRFISCALMALTAIALFASDGFAKGKPDQGGINVAVFIDPERSPYGVQTLDIVVENTGKKPTDLRISVYWRIEGNAAVQYPVVMVNGVEYILYQDCHGLEYVYGSVYCDEFNLGAEYDAMISDSYRTRLKGGESHCYSVSMDIDPST